MSKHGLLEKLSFISFIDDFPIDWNPIVFWISMCRVA
jgi:hypothetical protein